MKLAEMCREARESMRLSQSKFAQLIGTNQTEVSFIERGFVPSDKEKVKAIENLFKEAKIYR
jgi:transcriptional regulator with XRE-family HTH domain